MSLLSHHGAEEGVVAASPVLELVETDRRTLRVSLRGKHRAIKVEGEAGKAPEDEPVEDQRAHQNANILRTLGVEGT